MMDTATTTLDAALAGSTGGAAWDTVQALLKAGAWLLLIEPGTKEPVDLRTAREKAHDAKAGRSGSGLHVSTNRLDRLERLWERAVAKYGVEPNVAIDVERSGLVVIDADQAHETADVQRRALEGTDAPPEAYSPTVTTPGAQDAAGKWVHSGGGHFHYAVDTDVPVVREFGLPGGARVSMAGRYVLVPPSVRNEGPYTATGPVRLLSSAPWLVDLIRAQADADEADTARRADAAQERAQRRATDGPSNVEAWNDARTWDELLTAYDWTPTGKRDNCRCAIWTAPGDHASPKSATAHEDGCTNRRVDLEGGSGPLHIWTDNPPAELEGRDRWTKAQFTAAMRHQTMEEFLVQEGLVADEAAAVESMALEVDAATEEWFWTRHENLEAIRTYARLHRASPWGTLGAVLAIVAAAVPPYVTLPALVGGRAPLNTFVALVAPSGGGKGTSTRAAYGVLAGLPAIRSNEAGSGEGLVKAYGFRNRKLDDTNTYRITDTFLVDVPEVDSLYSVSGRLGATISASLRKAWSGEALGFQYADTTKAATIPGLAYRLAGIVGVQPLRAGQLFGEHGGGLPQRFVFFPTNDPGFTAQDRAALRQATGGVAPRVDVSYIAKAFPPLDPFTLPVADSDEDGERPATVEVWRPLADHEFHDVKVGPAAEAAVDEAADSRLSLPIDADVAEDEELAGHRNLLQLRTAAVLSVLVGEGGDVSDDVWDLAGVVLAKSDETVGLVRKVLRKVDRKVAEAKGKAMASLEIARDTAKGKAAEVIRDEVREKLLGLLVGGEWVPKTAVRNKFKTGPRRDAYVEVLAELVEEGVVEEAQPEKAVLLRLVTEASS
ncbi:bifunctional DNA primase/polymerase [Rhodococcus indonesiensis]